MLFRTILFLFLINFVGIGVHAQKSIPFNALADWEHVVVKGNELDIHQATLAVAGFVKYTAGDIAAISIPKGSLEQFKNVLQSRVQISTPRYPGTVLNDTMVINTKVDEVHLGMQPLGHPLEGEGVVIGFIDTGIDVEHEDFKSPDGKTRIKFIWEQANDNGALVEPYRYGREWSASDIDNKLCTHRDTRSKGHGTHVAGSAAGNGRAVGNYVGVAPESDIIYVAIRDFGSSFLNYVADGVDYIFRKADELGKPCVINTSLGTAEGSHDGEDLWSQIISFLINEQPGRAVTASAGNYGVANPDVTPYHLRHLVRPGTDRFTWFQYNKGRQWMLFELWGDTADMNDLTFQIRIDDPSNNFSYKTGTSFLGMKSHFNFDAGGHAVRTENLFIGGQLFANLRMEAFIEGDKYGIQFYAGEEVTNEDYYWRLTSKGHGMFDVWGGQFPIPYSKIVGAEGVPDTAAFPSIVNYAFPDSKQSIVSSWQCSDEVLTVGAYRNRYHFLNRDSNYATDGGVAGSLYKWESIGPTRDGRLKPDITAPGEYVISSRSAAGNSGDVALGGKHWRQNGTSMSSPVAAGIIALYFQEHPEANWEDVLKAITLTAIEDEHTGYNLPDTAWGYGKVDAMAMITAVIGCTDPAAENYNENATVEDGSCTYKTVSAGSLELSPVKVFPNPANEYVVVDWGDGFFSDQVVVQVYNELGQLVEQKNTTDHRLNLYVANFAAGIYRVVLSTNDKRLTTSITIE